MRSRLSKLMRSYGGALLAAAIVTSAAAPAFGAGGFKKVMQGLDSANKRGRMQDVAGILSSIGAMAPKDFPEWGAIAQKGAAAARKRDMKGVQASCDGCHDKYKESFRAKFEKN